jgi:Leucine-rich repeat (LRR) protein
LNLKFCKKLKKLPKEVGNLVNLSKLDFYRSGIRDLSISEDSTESSEEDGSEWSFSEDDSIIDDFQKDILDLNFSGKNIDTNLFGIVLYSNLEELDLSNTNLEELPALMIQLQKLKKLNLSKNPGINSIDKVHDAIFGLSLLESIKLTENGEEREYNKEEIAEEREKRIENLEEELKKIPYGRSNLTNDQRNEFIKEYLFDRKYQRKIDEKIFKDRLQKYQETFAQWRAKKVLLSKLKAA